MIWKQPTDHASDCYFCTVPPVHKELSQIKKWSVQYSNISSALCPDPHNRDIPFPDALEWYEIESYDGKDNETSESELLTTWPKLLSNIRLWTRPHKSKQPKGIAAFELPKIKAELLGSSLLQWNLLASDLRFSHFPYRHTDLVIFFPVEGDLTYCNYINESYAIA